VPQVLPVPRVREISDQLGPLVLQGQLVLPVPLAQPVPLGQETPAPLVLQDQLEPQRFRERSVRSQVTRLAPSP
jgi:hypothetical protein